MKTATVKVTGHGPVVVFHAGDEAGNDRLCPVEGASLESWRADQSRLPPWLLPDDLKDADEFVRTLESLRSDSPPIG